MLDVQSILNRYYNPESPLGELLILHSKQVAELATAFIKHSPLKADIDFVYEAAMLHDIGVFLTHAPSILCTGTEPYIKHGILGAKLLREIHNLPRHALVCERHTGTGLSANEIIRQKLPLPAIDFIPETIEEQVICYADKFFSKSRVTTTKSYSQVAESLQKFGIDTISRLEAMKELFGTPDILPPTPYVHFMP
ncbi:MAG: HDIG domain-containing protein [Bacteroidaceae bacterium]|nr:HDIG domain-containing protein [Bacteroidaceae bacterium]